MQKKEEKVLSIISDTALTTAQKKHFLSVEGENILPRINVSTSTKKLYDEGVLCDLHEGNAPYRPRYVLPNYQKLFENGSEFLGLNPPQDLFEATQTLLIAYNHVPSITGKPVYLGDVDKLLQPFTKGMSQEEVYKIIKWFLIAIDRVLADGFCHMNIGPENTLVGRLILKAERELKQPVPNISLKYSPKITDDELLEEAAKTALVTGKPHFHNHPLIKEQLGDYGVVSCYNNLLIGGGSHTLIRINLLKLANKSESLEEYLHDLIPAAVDAASELANSRNKFLVEDAKFFESDFLAQEGLIDLDKFTSMVGIFGLAEVVNKFSKGTYGKDEEANSIGLKIVEKIYDHLMSVDAVYCQGTEDKLTLHAQSGISDDIDETPGTRIPIGDEPELYQHLCTVIPMHKYFNSGISDIFIFDQTVKDNPKAMCDIIKGAMKQGIRTFTANQEDSELIRITGYLIKRSDLENFSNNKKNLQLSGNLGAEAVVNQRILNRKVRKLHE
ncbi:YjjI family glycine radical enzyme [Proteinivorax hydrogeniformans]|uniref:YjjI family glycine radical enzyme n=1 Tax=Proteinivorax hydrogeniformans TaxID=1826727 RepID=A0AAU8HW36_9FIRM